MILDENIFDDIQKIFDSRLIDIYKGIKKEDQTLHFVYFFKNFSPQDQEIAQFVRLNSSLADLAISTIAPYSSYEQSEEGFSIIYDSSGYTEPLKQYIKKGISFSEWMMIAHQILETLKLLHEKNINIGALSIDNIFYKKEGDKIKIRIFGLGFIGILPVFNKDDLNSFYFGDPNYIAPEILKGGKPDFASDFYSAGILLYELITKKKPFSSSNPGTTIRRQIHERPLPIHLIKPRFENIKVISKFLEKLLAKNPEKRLNSSTAIEEEFGKLTQFLKGDKLDELIERVEIIPEDKKEKQAPEAEEKKEEISEEPAEVEERKVVSDKKETLLFTGINVSELPEVSKEEKEKPSVKEEKEEEIKIVEPSSTEEEAAPVKKVSKTVAIMESVEQPEEKTEEKPVSEEKPKEKPKKKEAEKIFEKEEEVSSWFKVSGDDLSGKDSELDFETVSRKSSKIFYITVGILVLIVLAVVVIFKQKNNKKVKPKKRIVVTLPEENKTPEKKNNLLNKNKVQNSAQKHVAKSTKKEEKKNLVTKKEVKDVSQTAEKDTVQKSASTKKDVQAKKEEEVKKVAVNETPEKKEEKKVNLVAFNKLKQKALKELAKKNYDNARKLIKKALEENPDSTDAKIILKRINDAEKAEIEKLKKLKLEEEKKKQAEKKKAIEKKKVINKTHKTTPKKITTKKVSKPKKKVVSKPKKKAFKKDVAKSDKLFKEGFLLLRKKDYKNALRKFQLAKKYNPDNKKIDIFIKKVKSLMKK